jgi:hypothetical protein
VALDLWTGYLSGVFTNALVCMMMMMMLMVMVLGIVIEWSFEHHHPQDDC